MEGRCRFGRARGTASGSRGNGRIETSVNYVRINNNMDIVASLGGPHRMFNNAGVACIHQPFPSPALRVNRDTCPLVRRAVYHADNRVRERTPEKIQLYIYIYTHARARARAHRRPIVDCRRFDSRHERSPIRRERPAESRRSIVTRRFSLSVAPRSSCRRLTSLLRCRADNPDGVSSRRCNRPSIIRRRGWISALIVAVTGNGRHRRDGGRTSARARQKDNGSYRRG